MPDTPETSVKGGMPAALKTKVGPLPAWGWGVVLIGGVAGFWLLKRRGGANLPSGVAYTDVAGNGQFGGGSGGGGSSGSTEPPPPSDRTDPNETTETAVPYTPHWFRRGPHGEWVEYDPNDYNPDEPNPDPHTGGYDPPDTNPVTNTWTQPNQPVDHPTNYPPPQQPETDGWNWSAPYPNTQNGMPNGYPGVGGYPTLIPPVVLPAVSNPSSYFSTYTRR